LKGRKPEKLVTIPGEHLQGPLAKGLKKDRGGEEKTLKGKMRARFLFAAWKRKGNLGEKNHKTSRKEGRAGGIQKKVWGWTHMGEGEKI